MSMHELVELEQGFWGAAGNGAFYVEHMHDEGRCLLPVGTIDKESTVIAISQASPWSSYEFDDVAVHELGEHAVALTYRATATRENADTYLALISSTYRRVAGVWKLYLHQQTPLVAM